jgi:hypothetical protein
MMAGTLLMGAMHGHGLAGTSRDTITWHACFRLDAKSQRELRPSRTEACGTLRMPVSVLNDTSGQEGSHTVRFDEIAVKAGGGSSTGRLWIERVGGDTLRVALNTVVGTDTPTGRIFVTSDEAAVYFIVVAADAVSSVPWEQNSCWDYCARGTVKLRRL